MEPYSYNNHSTSPILGRYLTRHAKGKDKRALQLYCKNSGEAKEFYERITNTRSYWNSLYLNSPDCQVAVYGVFSELSRDKHFRLV
jgi:hypothetical protein